MKRFKSSIREGVDRDGRSYLILERKIRPVDKETHKRLRKKMRRD